MAHHLQPFGAFPFGAFRLPPPNFGVPPSTLPQPPNMNGAPQNLVTTTAPVQQAPQPSVTPNNNPYTPVMGPTPAQMAAMMSGRPNTTCNICFKVFACYSALEIHYRR